MKGQENIAYMEKQARKKTDVSKHLFKKKGRSYGARAGKAEGAEFFP